MPQSSIGVPWKEQLLIDVVAGGAIPVGTETKQQMHVSNRANTTSQTSPLTKRKSQAEVDNRTCSKAMLYNIVSMKFSEIY